MGFSILGTGSAERYEILSRSWHAKEQAALIQHKALPAIARNIEPLLFRSRNEMSQRATNSSKHINPGRPVPHSCEILMRRKFLLPALCALFSIIGCFSFRQTILPTLGGSVEGERERSRQAQPNYHDGKLQNQLPLDESLSAVLGAITGESADSTRPEQMLEFPEGTIAGPAAPLAATWMGHSTVLLEIDTLRVLFDPMWSDYASPLSGVGPERYLVPPIALDDVDDIDVVIVSHDHYDHLDKDSISTLSARGTRFVVPVGIGAHLEAWGVPGKQISELGWWQELRMQGVRIVCTPSRHFSGRELFDRYATLWSGWALQGPTSSAYFSGDSGYGPHFAEIGRQLGPFDLTMLEVGSYDPAWPDVHLGPEQALKAHRDVRGRHLLPVHWATFVMGNHGWTEPGERLLAARTDADSLLLPRPGQRVITGEDAELPRERWWPETPWRTAAEAPIVATTPAPLFSLSPSGAPDTPAEHAGE